MSQTPPAGRAGPRVHLIAALASNRVIGAAGKLPWHLPEDLRRFKALTLGHPVIMGRRTWDSLGKPLPGRQNIVVSRSHRFEAPGARVAESVEAALTLCAESPVAYVIGGGELYLAALRHADALLLTEIRRDYEGDARFPEIDLAAWRERERVSCSSADGLRYDFVRYERIRSEWPCGNSSR